MGILHPDMLKRYVSLVIVGAVCAVSASPARAQAINVDVAGGYSALSASSGSMPLGWFVSAGRDFNDLFGIVGEVAGNYKSTTFVNAVTTSLSEHTFLAGPRIVLASDKQTVSAHFLVGVATASATGTGTFGRTTVTSSASDTAICYEPGVGVDLDFNKSTALRLEANFRLVTANGSVNEFQFLVGVAHRFR